MLNPVSRTFKGNTDLTVNNADERFCVMMSGGAGNPGGKGEEVVTLCVGHASEHHDVIIGVYSANPGHEDNDVSIELIGEIVARVNEAVTRNHLGRGLITSTTAGIAEFAPAPTNAGGPKIGWGRCIGGYSEGTKHYARMLAG